MKIFDILLLNHEVEMLEIRMNILDPYVDYFILTEGNKTFSGLDKESTYLKNKDVFKKWEKKIIHNQIEIPDLNITWDREIFSRNSALSLNLFEDDDILLTSDIDEIPNPKVLFNIDEWITDDNHHTFRQKCYTYYLNNFYSDNWFGTRAARYRYMKNNTIDNIREGTEDVSKISGPLVENGGWHFTYCGDAQQIRGKIKSFCDTQFNIPEVMNNIENNLLIGKDIFYRNINYQVVDLDNSYPDYLLDNKEKYKHLIRG
jgi:beta-1,4-mannosyl-glycoprotein beta-1,4-N-acetylglucosaminyltransferase